MGEVRVKIRLTNFVDVRNAENQLISLDQIRTLDVDMVVDTGATMMILSEEIAENLGIQKEKEVFVRLADDSLQRHYKGRGILVEFGERDCVTDCIILERGVEPLLGQIPLEEMDLVVDCKNHQLIPNPDSYEGRMIVNAR